MRIDALESTVEEFVGAESRTARWVLVGAGSTAWFVVREESSQTLTATTMSAPARPAAIKTMGLDDLDAA